MVYTIDLAILCVQTHIRVVVRVLSSPQVAMWFGYESPLGVLVLLPRGLLASM